MSLKTLLQGFVSGNMESNPLSADTNVSCAMVNTGSAFEVVDTAGLTTRLLLLTSEPFINKGAVETWNDTSGVIASGDTGECIAPRKNDKVYVWLNTGEKVALNDNLAFDDNGTFKKIGTAEAAILQADEAVDNSGGASPVRIKCTVL